MRFRLAVPDTTGLHYAVRIFIGTALLWLALHTAGDANPIWAVISLIVVIEPKVESVWLSFLSRTVHTIAGCVVGLLFLLAPLPEGWTLAAAVTTTVLVCNYLIRVPLSWRIAPITAALVIASAATDPSPWGGVEIALRRTGEVLLGSATALLVTWVLSLVWMPREAAVAEQKPDPAAPLSRR